MPMWGPFCAPIDTQGPIRAVHMRTHPLRRVCAVCAPGQRPTDGHWTGLRRADRRGTRRLVECGNGVGWPTGGEAFACLAGSQRPGCRREFADGRCRNRPANPPANQMAWIRPESVVRIRQRVGRSDCVSSRRAVRRALVVRADRIEHSQFRSHAGTAAHPGPLPGHTPRFSRMGPKRIVIPPRLRLADLLGRAL
jgi:hypothetical protein